MQDGREFSGADGADQLAALAERALDSRPATTSPFPALNAQLHRGGLHPGNLVILGGRMHTRKSAVMLNWVMHLLQQDVPVGVLTLDESLAMYTAKLMSVMSQKASDLIEDNWETPPIVALRDEYAELARNLTFSQGVRPNFDQLQVWLEMADTAHPDAQRPRVVFIDYITLLVHYRRREHERVMSLFEELQVWTHENELVVVALHQAGRTDEGVSKKYHGDTPMTAEGLMYGGEAQADVILSTYRPALNQLGNMGRATAESILGDKFEEDKWLDACARVRKTQHSTFLQLLKNRPSTKGLNFEGVELYSPNDSQYMEEAA